MENTENKSYISNIVYLIGEIGFGGTEKQMTLVLRYLKNPHEKYHLIVFNRSYFGSLKKELMSLGVEIYFIPKSVNSIYKRLKYLINLIKIIKPKLIHSWTIHDNSYAYLVGAYLGISKTFGSVRGSLYGTSFAKLPELYKISSIRFISRIFVNTLSIRNELIDYGINKSKISVIANAVEPRHLTDYIINENSPVICTIGNLRYNKNHETFVKIMKNVVEIFPKAEGWIIGQPVPDEPNQEKKIKKLINELNINNSVKLMGFQSNPMSYLEKASVFILLSKNEGQPNVILEAMSLGVPVVASNTGGIPEIINHGKNGFIYHNEEHDRFVNKIVELIKDSSKREKIVNKAHSDTILKHNPKKIVSLFRKFYDD